MRIALLCLWMTMIGAAVYADTYVIVKSDTKEIVSVSPWDDAVVEEGCEKVVLKKDYVELNDATDYKLINDKFVEDVDKISDRENKRIKAEKRMKEEKKIENEMKRQAYESLKAKGEVFTEIKSIDDIK